MVEDVVSDDVLDCTTQWTLVVITLGQSTRLIGAYELFWAIPLNMQCFLFPMQ